QVASSYLHGDLTGTELIGYIPVGTAGDHQRQNLSLPGLQRLVAPTEFGQLTLLLPPSPIPGKTYMDRIEKILIAKRFREEFHGARFHRAYRHWNISVCGYEDDGDTDVSSDQLCLQVQSAESRQPYIQDHAVRAISELPFKKVVRRCEGFGFEADRTQQVLQRAAHGGVVLNDKHAAL